MRECDKEERSNRWGWTQLIKFYSSLCKDVGFYSE